MSVQMLLCLDKLYFTNKW